MREGVAEKRPAPGLSRLLMVGGDGETLSAAPLVFFIISLVVFLSTFAHPLPVELQSPQNTVIPAQAAVSNHEGQTEREIHPIAWIPTRACPRPRSGVGMTKQRRCSSMVNPHPLSPAVAKNGIMFPSERFFRIFRTRLEKTYGKDESAEFLRTARHEI